MFTYATETQAKVTDEDLDSYHGTITAYTRTYVGSGLHWQQRDESRPSELLVGNKPSAARRAGYGATISDDGQSLGATARKPTGASTDSASGNYQYRQLTFSDSDSFYRRRYDFGRPGFATIPPASMLADLSEYYYPSPDALVGEIPVSYDPPSRDTASWVIQQHPGHAWAPSNRRWRESYGTEGRFVPIAGDGAFEHDDRVHLERAAGYWDVYRRSWCFRELAATYAHAEYGLPDEVIVAFQRDGGGASSADTEWRLRLSYHTGTALVHSYSPVTTMPTSTQPVAFVTTLSGTYAGTLPPGALDFNYGLEWRVVGATRWNQGDGMTFWKRPCALYEWAVVPGPMKGEGAIYWPGWLRYLGSI